MKIYEPKQQAFNIKYCHLQTKSNAVQQVWHKFAILCQNDFNKYHFFP